MLPNAFFSGVFLFADLPLGLSSSLSRNMKYAPVPSNANAPMPIPIFAPLLNFFFAELFGLVVDGVKELPDFIIGCEA